MLIFCKECQLRTAQYSFQQSAVSNRRNYQYPNI
nr:MAG TPA: DNA-directed RNA polymerase III subunit [Caudoviricetes sp.]